MVGETQVLTLYYSSECGFLSWRSFSPCPQYLVEQVDPPVDSETEECYRRQSRSEGGKHDLGTRWAKGQMGWEARSMCTVYQVRLGLKMDDLYAHVSSSACTDQEGG